MALAEKQPFSEIFKLSDTQLIMAVDASRVNYKRDEERRRLEKTCEQCGAESVINGKCTAEGCGAHQLRSDAIIESRGKATDVLLWKGVKYVGDAEETAEQKLKKVNPEEYVQYLFRRV
jgi:hypothetical protein